MYGWRARIGIIYPASGLADHEYYQMAPEGVSIHVTRSPVPHEGGVTLEDVLEVAGGETFTQLARDLATVKPHCIAWMCTSGSFSRGVEWDNQLIRMIEEASGTKAITTSTALTVALRSLGVSRVACGTPYEPRINEKLKGYLEDKGFQVVNIQGLNLFTDWEIGSVRPEVAYNLAKEVDRSEAEAIFISDTGVRLIELVDLLEAELDKPVMSANMVTMWHALRLSGIREPIDGLGRLFRTPLVE
jgi:maleate isomerase